MAEKRYTVDNLPAVGTIYAFRLADGRYGACRVAKVVSNADSGEWAGICPVIVMTTYLDNEIPQLEDERLKEVLRLTHHAYIGALVCWTVSSPPSSDFMNLGVIYPPESDQDLPGNHIGFWSAFNGNHLLLQEEWDNGNHEEILRRQQEEFSARLLESERKEKERLAHLGMMSLKQFRCEKFFSRWEEYMKPKIVVQKSRRLFRSTIDALIDLGDKPKKQHVHAHLKLLIEGFNVLQQQYRTLETSERDDICQHLSDLCYVLKLTDDPVILFEQWEDL